MSGIIMEQEDFVRLKDAELAAEREENARLRVRCQAAEEGQELAIANGLKWQRAYMKARKQLQSWADEADQQSKLLQQLERQGYEL